MVVGRDLFGRLCAFRKKLLRDEPSFVEVFSVEFANKVPFGVYRLSEELSKELTRVRGFPVYFFIKRVKRLR